jgi:hypothetical protein
LASILHLVQAMTRTWTTTLTGVLVAAAIACGPAPDRDATQEATGTTGRQAGEVTVTGCLALGQMGIYMLTPEGATGNESGIATTGYQLLGQPDDFNQYMNKRVRVTGTTSEAAQERPASNAPPSAHDKTPDPAPWPKLQVREVDPIGGECR